MKNNKRWWVTQNGDINGKIVGVMLALLILMTYLVLSILGYQVEGLVPLGVAVVGLICWAFVRID